MPTTTGDPRIDNNDAIQSWVDYCQLYFNDPTPDLEQAVELVRKDLRAVGVSRWTADLRAVLWAQLIAACTITATREWRTCREAQQDPAHWTTHHNDKWAFAASTLILIDLRTPLNGEL